MRLPLILLCSTLCLLPPAPTLAQSAADDGFAGAVQIGNGYNVKANVTYLTASGRDLKLDVYQPSPATSAVPVVINFHGGGWVAGSREGSLLKLLPYMQMGFAVVNVEYRLGKTALAPAAVEDTLCALQWVGRNAKEYNFDLSKVVATGGSAGGHLALATAMIPSDSPLTNQCALHGSWSGPYVNPAPKVAAVINWFGITDVADMLEGPNVRSYAVAWFGATEGRKELARSLSPLSYVRKDGPAVLTIHGDADPLVPYAHALRLRQAMDKAGQKNRLLTIKGGGHGGFTPAQDQQAYLAMRDFLRELGIVAPAR
ncbi:alpha/beta hydrolase [Oxalobacteraceae bacterium OTU3CINTB1]|nr:alpha/beta hydrolase [Oxalobacteraceae bacterium OTU3CINTB1]